MTSIHPVEAQVSHPATVYSEEKQRTPPTDKKDYSDKDSNVSAPENPVTQTATPLVPAPPDGGSDAWLCVLGGWFGFFVTWGWINSIGVFQEYYQNDLLSNYSPSTVAWIPSTEVFFLFLGGPICGKIFDNYGPRELLLGGGFLHIFGLMMASLGTEYYQLLLAQSVCSSAGASAIFYATMNAVSTWFLKKRATAIGIIASGSSLGGVILPIMVTRLIPMIGFGWTMRTLAFMFLGMLAITVPVTKSRLTHTTKPFQFMDFIHPLKEPPFVLLVLANFFFFFGNFLPLNFLILQAQEEGMSTSLSNYLLAIVNAASLFGRVLPGYIADHVGRYNMMIATTLCTAILVLALWIPGHGNAAIIVFSILYGFFSGAFVSLGPAVVAQISEIKQIGVRNGTVYAFVSVAALTGNPIAGALITRDNGKFLYLQLFCGLSMAVGCSGFLASRTAKVGLSWKRF